MREEDIEIIADVREKSRELHSLYSQEYERQADDLEFSTGSQWCDEDETKARGNDTPRITHNFIGPYIDRIVNPYNINPIKQIVNGTQNDEVVNAFIDKFERESNLQEAIQTAHRTQVACGRGYVHLCTEYEDEETNAVVIDVDPVRDPTMIYLGPHEKIDGSDAEYGMAVKWIDEKEALDKVGDDSVSDAVNVWENWQRPDNTVAEVLYYRMDKDTFTRSYMDDGAYVDEDVPEEIKALVLSTRKITRKSVEMIHVIGDTVINKAKYNISALPIIPVYGKVKYTDNGLEYSGVVDAMRDSQRKINLTSSIELQLIEDAPKAPWLLSVGQVGGDPKLQAQWREAGSKRFDSLIYKTEDVMGKPVPPPQRVNNEAQTAAITNAKINATSDLARETGIYDGAFGDTASQGVEAASTVLSRGKQQELMTASYTDNLMRSIKQIYKVALQLMHDLYDTPKTVEIDGEQGEVVFSELQIDFKKVGFELSSAPSMESRRAESIANLQSMMQLYPPAAPLVAIRVAENMSIPNRDALVEDLKKLLPPELQEQGEEAPDPQAMQAMQTAQETIAALEEQVNNAMGYIEQLQTVIIDDEKDRANKLAIERLKIERDLAIARIKAEVDLAKAQAKTNIDLMKVQQDAEKSMLDIVEEAVQEDAQVDVERTVVKPDDVDMPPVVEGPMGVSEETEQEVIQDLGFEGEQDG